MRRSGRRDGELPPRELRAIGKEATELTLTHRLLPDQGSAEAHHAGWSRGFDNLVARFAA